MNRRNNRNQVPVAQIKDPKVEPFSGKENEDFKHWYEDFIIITNNTTLTMPRKISLLKRSLKGDARNLFEALNCDRLRTIKSIYDALAETLCDKDKPEDWKVKLRSLKYQPDESLKMYSARIKHAVKRAYPDVNGNLESIEVDWFVQNLPKDISQRVIIKKPRTLEKALEVAEEKLAKKRKETRQKSPVRTTQLSQLDADLTKNELRETDEPREKRQRTDNELSLNYIEGRMKQQTKSLAGQLTKQMLEVKKSLEGKLNSIQQQQGSGISDQRYHDRRYPYQHRPSYHRHQPQQRSNSSRDRFNPRFKQRPRPTSKTCYACGKVGHLKRDCRSINRQSASRDNALPLN